MSDMHAKLLPALLTCICLISVAAQSASHKPTAQEVSAIVLAVEDEIYDWGFEKDYTNIGTTGAIDEPTDVRVFILPEIDENEGGHVMYRLMPFGEVVRGISFRPDGTAILWGNPWNGFPATQPDTRTIYLDDDSICAFKQKAIGQLSQLIQMSHAPEGRRPSGGR